MPRLFSKRDVIEQIIINIEHKMDEVVADIRTMSVRPKHVDKTDAEKSEEFVMGVLHQCQDDSNEYNLD